MEREGGSKERAVAVYAQPLIADLTFSEEL
jgi:hypothetical protein